MELSILVAAIIGLTEAAKRSGMSSKWAPVVSIVLGLGASFAFNEGELPQLVIEGIILGLTASGLWSGTKAVITK